MFICCVPLGVNAESPVRFASMIQNCSPVSPEKLSVVLLPIDVYVPLPFGGRPEPWKRPTVCGQSLCSVSENVFPAGACACTGGGCACTGGAAFTGTAPP